MSVNEMLMAAAGASGAANEFVEDCFATHLYQGNGSTQTITNGIDLAGEGGLVWTKDRTGTESHDLEDTVRGAGKLLYSNLTNAQATNANAITSFNSNGYSFGSEGQVNRSGSNFVSWTFRKAPKFFDVVTYTGDGVTGRNIPHSLGSTPGMIIIKCTSTAYNWLVWHRSVGGDHLLLNSTSAAGAETNCVSATSSNIVIDFPISPINRSGETYVAYLFAHDAGGFGADGTDNIISCGSFTTDGSGNATVNLGYEPQFVLTKITSTTGTWALADSMRGNSTLNGINNTQQILLANTSGAEFSSYGYSNPTATGFQASGWGSSQTFIYMAIRRPMKTPTTGTEVFYLESVAQADLQQTSGCPFSPDFALHTSRNGTFRTAHVNQVYDRLRGIGVPSDTYGSPYAKVLVSSSTDAETEANAYLQYKANGRDMTKGTGWNNAFYGNFMYWLFRRAPNFFDVVCYTGTGTAKTEAHNLGVAPDLMIVKRRSASEAWTVYCSALANTEILELDTAAAKATSTNRWDSTTPTSTVFTVGVAAAVNGSGSTYVAYLFSTLAGVSKVGSYTGNGSSQTINCGFTGGARFVLIKRTDSTGNWVTFDSARGIVSGNDPALYLNSTAAEVTTIDGIDPDSSGFVVNQESTLNLNVNGASYIYLSIA